MKVFNLIRSGLPLALVPLQFLIMTGSYAACTWKTSDIMDERIDVGAQKSLMRQMSSGPPNSRIASAMIGAIKSGALAAIYLPPRQMVAQRAARMTPKKGYWQLLQGRNSTCLREPAGEPPIIVYRQKMNGDMIDVALREAWQQCGLPTPSQPCAYVVDRRQQQKVCDEGMRDHVYEACNLDYVNCTNEVNAAWEVCIQATQNDDMCAAIRDPQLRRCRELYFSQQRTDECMKKAREESGCQ